MSEKPRSDYEVGFARPPRSTQFRKGTSGNPKGRPRGSKSLSTIVKETLDEKVVVRENGSCRRITKRAAMIKQQANKAMSGDQRAFRSLIDLDLRLNPEAAHQENSIDALREAFEQARKEGLIDLERGPELEEANEPVSESNPRLFAKAVSKR